MPDYHHLISFDQSDTFGQAGYNGLVNAYKTLLGFDSAADPVTPIARFRYDRTDASTAGTAATAAQAYLTTLLSADTSPHTVGVLMTDTYAPAVTFITAMRKWQNANDAQQASLQKATRLTLYFSNVSFVGPDALAARLAGLGTIAVPGGQPISYTQNVVVSQVVPNYQSDSSDVVTNYRTAMASANQAMTFTSLEGYIDARVFVSGLLAHQGPFTPDALISTFESLPDLSLGVGAGSGFSPMNHNYSKTVWGTSIGVDPKTPTHATFSNLYYWSEGTGIQFYQ